MRKIGQNRNISDRFFPYKDRIANSVLIREKKDKREHVL